jgi:hypothetical protein
MSLCKKPGLIYHGRVSIVSTRVGCFEDFRLRKRRLILHSRRLELVGLDACRQSLYTFRINFDSGIFFLEESGKGLSYF